MQKIIGVTDLQRGFRAIFDEVTKGRVPYVLTRGSRPEAALIPYADYQRFLLLDEQHVLERFDRLMKAMNERNSHIDEAELNADIEEARRELAS